MPAVALLLALLQLGPIPIPLPELDVGGEIVGPYIFREDAGQTTKVILQDGLTVIVREQNAVPLVNITTLVKVGYFDEPDELSGISHVAEHMFFKGTANRGVGEVARQTRALGGTLNAYTAYDRTLYHVVVPAANAVQAMEIQADALRNPAYDPAELAREIEVVLAENDRKLDNPRAVAEERLYSAAFDRHRIRRWRIGTPEGLRALTRDDLAAWTARYYQPSNTVLVVVGQFDREAMLADIVRLYGDAEDSAVERERGPSEPPQRNLRYDWERGPIAQSQVAIGFHVPGVLSPQAPALEVLSAILTSGRASRLNRVLREERGVVVSAASAYTGFEDLGFFRIQLETPEPADAERGAFEELARIRRFGVTEEELARARLAVASNYYRRLESVQGIGEQLAVNESLGDWHRLNAFMPQVEKVTTQDIQALAETYFSVSNTSVFEYATTSAQIAQTNRGFTDGILGAVPDDLLERVEEPLPVTVAIPLIDDDALVVDLVAEPEELSILRGPDVHVLGDSRLPLVSFGIFYPGGRLYEGEENAGITELMLRSALRGTRLSDDATLARRLENSGARIEVVNEPDFFGYILEGVTGSVRGALDVLVETLQEPTFPEAQVVAERTLQLARLRQLQDDGLRQPVQAFMEALYGDHPYARPALGLEASVPTLTPEDVSAWHREQLRETMPVIVVVGDTSGSNLVSSIAEGLTNFDLHERDLGELELPQPVPERREEVLETNRRQSALVYGTIGPAFDDQARAPLTVLDQVLSGLGGRLFDAIRERAGLAYTIRAYEDLRATGGAWFTYAAFSPENEARVRTLLDAEIRRLIEDGVTEDEVVRARNSAIGVHEASFQTRRARTLALARALIAGADVEAVTEFGKDLAAQDKEAVDAVVDEYLDPDSATVVVVRGRE